MTEIIFAVGGGADVVGVTTVCDYPATARHLPKVAGWTTTHDYSYLDTYQPDQVLTSMYLPPGLAAACAARQIALLHVDPHTVAEVIASIVTVGVALNRGALAQALADDLAQTWNELQQQQPTPRQRVYCEEWHTPPMVAGNWVPELVAAAGGVSLAPTGRMSQAVTAADVQAFDPDVIVAHWCGFGQRSRRQVIAQRPGWQALRAVTTQRIYNVSDSLLNRPGPRLLASVAALKSLFN